MHGSAVGAESNHSTARFGLDLTRFGFRSRLLADTVTSANRSWQVQ